MILVYTTCKNKDEAEAISNALLEKRMIACANIFPVTSIFWMNSKIKSDKEVALLIKTFEWVMDDLKIELKKLHSSEVPCIIAFEVDAEEEYNDWARGALDAH